ncbi:uncharacterized protein [Chiloscyllium punctatum]|uniref:uncharacterized protein isoform X2 n=1 Tax=Chiloscyllium punctatum TaxID=137246 RepID=UPI003B640995
MAQFEGTQPGGKDENTLKRHLQSSHDTLVAALYNIDPLLDQMIASHILTHENYYEIRTEKTPPQKARKLLEIVQLQMNEKDVWLFVECLRKCKNNYPRLKDWLTGDTVTDINRGPTAPYKREPAFPNQLHQDMEQPPLLSSLVPAPQEETEPISSLLQDLKLMCGYDEEIQLNQVEKELVREAMTLFQLKNGREMSLNVCEFGRLLGLPRKVVQDCLFELESAEDFHQLAAVIHTFMEKTNDAERLRKRMATADRYRLLLSRRAKLLLKLLQSGLANNHHSEKFPQQFSNICLFILRDCLAEVEEDASEVSTLNIMGCLQRLERNGFVDVTILKEFGELWMEGTAENLCRIIPFIAQLIRDVFPHLDTMEFDAVPVRRGIYRCHQRAVRRVTSFKGLPARIIQKVMEPKSVVLAKEQGIIFGNWELLAREFTQLSLKIAQILQQLQDYQSNGVISKHRRHLDKQDIGKEIRRALATENFGCSSFDSCMKVRLLSLVEFDPIFYNEPLFLMLHYDTFISFAEYLKTNDAHCFQFVFEEVHMYQCDARFHGVQSIRGPVMIDEGVEQVFQFSTSDRASFLVWLHCRGYRDGQYLQCNRPLTFKLSNLPASLQQEAEKAGAVVAKQAGATWLRDISDGGLKEIAKKIVQSFGGTAETGNCCFLIHSWGTKCEIRFLYKDDTITASVESNADIN